MGWRRTVAIVLASGVSACGLLTNLDDLRGDAAVAEGGAESGVTQDEFCDAEAFYFHQCGFDDAACAQVDLNRCGAIFSAFANGFAGALAHCMETGQLPCSGELTNDLSSACITAQLAGYQNDSGALAAFANDFCDRCDKGSPTCVGKFASASDQPGYLPSLFADSIIQQMDDCEKKFDGGAVATPDGSVSCLQQTLICEYVVIGLADPPSACTDQ